MRKKNAFTLLSILSSTIVAQSQTIQIIYTTDVHGSIFSYDYIKEEPTSHSLSQAISYIDAVRDTAKYTILLDNGDNLQGTPIAYYYNFVDTTSTHIVARAFNYMKYDAICVGNHDIETGHQVYDRIRKQYDMPLLAANVIKKSTGEPYFNPYTIVERGGKRIAIIGLLTPYIPHWLPEHFWQGMDFEDMVKSAQKWITIVKEKEKPDAIIGLFHAGFDYTYGNQTADSDYNENASILVAEHVEGFDAILIGHDHKLYNSIHKSPSGHDVVVLDAGAAARNVGLLTIDFVDGKAKCSAKLISLAAFKESEKFNKQFTPQSLAVKAFSQKLVAQITNDINAYESLFGNSSYVDLVQEIMLHYTNADISVTAPLSINAKINKGNIKIGNMFSLYKYENMLNVIELSGEEIKKYLEYSYDLWINNPNENNGHLLNVDNRGRLKNKEYCFDSAAGIDYTVNPYKPNGERVTILKMSNGKPFDIKAKYKVAINSYRCNGGGGHLEFGVGLKHEEIQSRIITTYNQDLRGIIINEWQLKGKINPKPASNWKFVPEKDLKNIIEKEKQQFKTL